MSDSSVKKITPWTIVKYILVYLASLLFISPFIMMIIKSLENGGLDNYTKVFETSQLGYNFISSTVITACTVFLVLLVTLPAAFAFSKLKLRGSSALYYFIMSAMMMPPAVSLVPLLMLVKNMGLLDNYFSVIFPFVALFIPFAVLITRNSMDDLPNEILEAAYIDGASTFQSFMLIIVPLSRATILVTITFTFMNAWNEYLYPLCFLRSSELQTVTVVPMRFLGSYYGNIPQVFAAGNMILLPVVILYLFLQKYFEAGFVNGAIKG